MKKIFIGLLISCSAFISGADFSLKPLLSSVTTDTQELQWQSKNLTVDDFKDDGTTYPHVTSLDLSNNSFRGEFPLSSCLKMFPKLKTLVLNDNPNMTGFEIEKAYKNSTLACISAENSGIATIKLGSLYTNFDVTTLDLSRSAQLADFDLEFASPRSSRGTLQLHLRDVIIPEEKIGNKKITGDSLTKDRIVAAGGMLMPIISTAALSGGIYANEANLYPLWTYPFYKDHGSPDEINANHVTNSIINFALIDFLSAGVGIALGKFIARKFLPNQGKVTMVQFIMNSSTDDVV